MITNVKKRDGSVVPFDPEKISRWAEWAKVVGVDWFSIVCAAYSKCSDGCSTVELHDAMISSCEDLRTTAGLKMAGRLLVGDLYKRVYGGHNLPTLKEQYKNMVAQGYMEDMGYSDEELDYLNTVIDHSKDFELTSTQVRQDMQKYLLNDVVSKTPKETPQFGVMRQAMGACKSEPSDTRIDRVVKMYQMIADSVINTPTPNKNNLGTPKRSYASCCKSVATDTLASIEAQNHIYYTMTAASAGIGGFAMIRSKGDKVRNGVIKHGGKIPYFRLKEAEAKANKQGQRGGAVTEYVNALDPEIFTLLALRNPTSVDDQRVDGLDYAFQYNKSFIERAKKGKDWLLISYKDAPELWTEFFSPTMEHFDARMDYLIKCGKGKVVKARDLLKKFLSENEVTGRLYEFSATNVNSHGAFDEPIVCSNLCVVPETKILTKQGYQEIGSLAGQKIELWNGEEWSLSDVFKTGEDQPLVKVRMADGKHITCTPYHRFYLWDGEQETVVRAEQLKPGDSLTPWYDPILEEVVYDDVDSVEHLSRTSDTYCFNEPKRNRGVFNGILAGNCMEYLAPVYPYHHIKGLYEEEGYSDVGEVAICNLGAISVGRFPLTHAAYYDAAFHTLLMVDNVIEVGTFPLPHVEYTAKARRTAGVGITNLAYAMAKEGLKYSSQEGKDFCHRLAELHTYSLLKASVALAKERGPCEWHHRTRYAKGWLPVDTYCKEVDNITSQPLLCDWEGLRKEIAEHGLRNSALVNHMPVESSSIRAGDTNGLYSIRDGIVLKKSGNTKTIFIPPEWEELGSNYEKAWDIPWKDMADIYAIFQKFADQGISADMYHAFPPGDKRVSMKQLMEEFFYRNKVGLKTRYYRNFKIGASEMQQEEACSDGGCKL